MKVLLCGYREAGCGALDELARVGHQVLVASHPAQHGVPCLLTHARDLGFDAVDLPATRLAPVARCFAPEVTFSMYYREILPPDVLRLSRLGSYNFHPSLLPRHRGCFSAPWAIIEGDRETGVTCHHMIERIDAGDIVEQIRIPVHDGDTGRSLYFRLVDAAVELFRRVVGRIEQGPLPGRPQHGTPSYHRRTLPYRGLIDPTWPRDMIGRFIRALDFSPYPPASVIIEGRPRPVRSMEEYDAVIGTAGALRAVPRFPLHVGASPAARDARHYARTHQRTT